jgi:hypothetical protein
VSRDALRVPARGGWLARLLPVLLVPVALLGDPAAILPTRTYFFRDFTATFFPLRVFTARELREGRLPFWNPYIFEGSFHLPALYPPDLLLAFWPSPAFASWLLTLHLPLAALAAFWLARELGVSRPGALLAGSVYALGGLALSSLNLYVFLQALALAPLVAGLVRRAALDGMRRSLGAGVVVALAISTLAVEFVAQAVLLGLVLGVVERPSVPGLKRLGVAVGLGVGLAGIPVALVLGLLPETARGGGFAPEVALGNSVHPAVLLQALLPHLFGLPQAPAEAWWGGRFFTKGLPYFLTLYLGPLTLALAAIGAGGLPWRRRVVLVGLGILGLLYALGEWGHIALLLARLPMAGVFRFPCKALLLPYLAVSICAGMGIERISRGTAGWRGLAIWSTVGAVLAVAIAVLVKAGPTRFVAWTGVAKEYWPRLVDVVRADAAFVLLLATCAWGIAIAVRRGLLGAGKGGALVAALVVADLVRAGAGMNLQVHPSFFDLQPQMAALPLRDPEGGRLFSYGLDQSPAFRAFLARGGRELTLASFYVYRQMLGPYTNILDGLETPEGRDLTGFVPREPELTPALYAPDAISRLLPWLRNAAVSRVLSLDALSDPALVPFGVYTPGRPGLAVHLYAVDAPWPREFIACRVIDERDPQRALLRPYASDFDPRRDVTLAGAEPAHCRHGYAHRREGTPAWERFDVDVADGPGYLVVRSSYARGWRALVDGSPVPLLRADGKHRAVRVPVGRHDVEIEYHPPGLALGLALTALSLLVGGVLWIVAPSRGHTGRGGLA